MSKKKEPYRVQPPTLIDVRADEEFKCEANGQWHIPYNPNDPARPILPCGMTPLPSPLFSGWKTVQPGDERPGPKGYYFCTIECTDPYKPFKKKKRGGV
jgi:hypothetical protein